MALPAAMYSNSLSGEVECVEMADARVGQRQDVRLRERGRRRPMAAHGR